jgi:hypothetical protein
MQVVSAQASIGSYGYGGAARKNGAHAACVTGSDGRALIASRRFTRAVVCRDEPKKSPSNLDGLFSASNPAR